MWICSYCDSENEEHKVFCWQCYRHKKVKEEPKPEPKKEPQEEKKEVSQ